MSDTEKKEIPPEKLVRVTFMPEGKTVEFEFGTMPYEHHGKPMSFLDVAENFGSLSRSRLRWRLRLHHVPPVDQGSGRHQPGRRRRTRSHGYGR